MHVGRVPCSIIQTLVLPTDSSHFSLFSTFSKRVVLWYYDLPYRVKPCAEKPFVPALVLGKYGQIGCFFESLKHGLLMAAVL